MTKLIDDKQTMKIKHIHIDYWDLEKIRTTILYNYPTALYNPKRCIIDKDILNPFLGLDIGNILEYKRNEENLGYDVWYK